MYKRQLLTVVPTSVLNEKMNFVMLRFLLFSGVVLALTLALVLYIFHMRTQSPVSYTHLDVYKRQLLYHTFFLPSPPPFPH